MTRSGSFLRRIGRGIKKLFGLQGYSDYFKRYFEMDNAHCGIAVSFIVMILEVYMTFYVLFHVFSGSQARSFLWLCQHLSSYFLLFFIALLLFLYSKNYLKHQSHRFFGKVIRIVFAIVGLAFGSYISYLDYAKGEQILSFVAMEIFIFGVLLWRPAVSFLLSSVSMLVFYFLCDSKVPASFATQINLFTVWLGIVVASVLRFQQKFLEAKKAEHIENMNIYLGEVAVTDETTGIGNMLSFRNKVGEIRSSNPADFLSRVFLFLDISNFSSYNEKHGFDEGSQLLSSVAHTLTYTFSGDPVSRFSDDHFIIFTKYDKLADGTLGFQEKLDSIRKKIVATDSDVKLGLKVGAYIPEDVSCHTNTACDFARYACDSIRKKYDVDYCEYTTASAEDFARRQYVINNIDKAVQNGYIHIYYQPVVLAKNRQLCGFEALARWIDPKYGFMPPYAFISTLEEYRQIHKLDAYIVKKVCEDILEAPADGVPVLPISINFSRLDFELMDIEALLEETIEKQNIDKKLIHIEVTESALSQNDKNLQETLRRLKAKDYSLWLDDFGSGYSGLNILKEYEFDMMKIDMAFLRNFGTTPKSRPILKNIVALANDIGMRTLSEGVETEDAFEFLREIGCERIQGYLFGKPMPKDEIMQKIRAGEFIINNA